MKCAARAMPDYGRIRSASGEFITSEDIVAIHFDHLSWLTRKIARPWPGQVAIFTHHAPGAAVSGHASALCPAFASDLVGWIEAHRPDYWF